MDQLDGRSVCLTALFFRQARLLFIDRDAAPLRYQTYWPLLLPPGARTPRRPVPLVFRQGNYGEPRRSVLV